MKFLSRILWLGELCTDANDANNTNNIDNYARQTNHDYTGSFGRIPNEPKISDQKYKEMTKKEITRCIGLRWLTSQMADSHLGLGSNVQLGLFGF